MPEADKERRQVTPLLFLLGSAIFYSGIAPLSLISEKISASGLLLGASFVAAVIHLPFLRFNLLWKLFSNPIPLLHYFFGGAILTFSYILFAQAIRLSANPIIPAIIFELYPIGIIIFSSLLIRAETFRISQLLWLLLGACGVFILSIGEANMVSLEFSQTSFETAEFLSLLAVFLFALGITLVSRGSKFHPQRAKYPAQLSIFSSFVARIGGLIAALPIFLLEEVSFSALSSEWIFIGIYGVFVIGLSNILYYIGMDRSESSVVSTVMYFGPVLGVFWLTMFGFGTITPFVALGGGAVVVSNLLLNLDMEEKPSYGAAIITLFALGTFIYFFEGVGEINYLNAISGIILFFALIYGYMVEKFAKRTALEEELLLSILNSKTIEGNEANNEDLSRSKSDLLEAVSSGMIRSLRDVYIKLNADLVAGFDYDRLDQFVLSRSRGISLGEMFVLSMTALLATGTAVFMRPYGLYFDLFGLVVSVSVMFVSFTLIDAFVERRFVLRGAIDRDPRTNVHDFVLSHNLFKVDDFEERLIAIVLLGLLGLTFGGLIASKYIL